MSISSPDLLLNLAYITLIVAGFARQLIWLRTILVIAAVGFVTYGVIEAIWPMVVWNSLTGSLHLARIIHSNRQQRSVKLEPAEAELRDEFFPGLSDFDFHVLWKMGAPVEYRDSIMIEQGSHPGTVALIIEGEALVEKDGRQLRAVQRGGLLGEMSFVSGRPATVDVRAPEAVVVREWDQRELATMDQVHPASARAFRALIQRDLVDKVQS